MPKRKVPEEEKIRIGGRLREIREKLELTQRQVEKDIGILQRALSGYECNKSIPPLGVLIKLARYYKVTVDYILLGNRDITELKKREREIGISEYAEKIEQLKDYEQRKAIKIIMKDMLIANGEKI